MNPGFRVLILDDDPDASAFLRYKLLEHFPEMQIETRLHPDVSGEFDIYFVDNDFDGCRLASQLAGTIRKQSSESLIFAVSSHLDADVLKDLINAGCNGVCEKHQYEDVANLLDKVEQSIAALKETEGVERTRTGVIKTIQSITELIREWNHRLSHSANMSYADTSLEAKVA